MISRGLGLCCGGQIVRKADTVGSELTRVLAGGEHATSIIVLAIDELGLVETRIDRGLGWQLVRCEHLGRVVARLSQEARVGNHFLESSVCRLGVAADGGVLLSSGVDHGVLAVLALLVQELEALLATLDHCVGNSLLQ